MASSPHDPCEPFWLALGRFVYRYAEIEQTMHQILRIVARTPDINAKVLFSGTRVSAATDIIKRFYTARKEALPADLVRAFDHIGTVTKARDRFLHNGLHIVGVIATVTDETKNIEARAFKHTVTVLDLEALSFDSMVIQGCLTCFWIETRRPDLIDSPAHLAWREYAQSPWRYKQPKPMKPKGKIRSSVRERKSPPQSSSG